MLLSPLLKPLKDSVGCGFHISLNKLASNTVDGSEILHQLRLVVYPIIYRVLYIQSGGWEWDF